MRHALSNPRCTGALLAVAAALMCGVAQAELYKWVDEHGTVNYSNLAPRNRSSQTVDPADSRITVYTPVKPSADELARMEEERRFRQHLALAEAQSPHAAGGGGYDPYPGWYAQCVNEMWADCDDPRTLATRYGAAYWGLPPVVVGARRYSNGISPLYPPGRYHPAAPATQAKRRG